MDKIMKTDKKNSKKAIDIQDLIEEWETGKEWIDKYTRDFTELDNLVDAVALSRTKNAPMVGDVTLASAVRQIPRASIQQLPTFSVEVNGTKLSFSSLICDFIVRRIVFNEDTFGKGVLSTMQIGAESALTHGFQPFMASLGNVVNDFGTTMKLVHYNDVVIETGVFDAADSYRDKIRTRVTKNKLKSLIEKAKNNPNTTWDVSALEELLALGPNASSLGNRESAPRYNITSNKDDNTFDIITDYRNIPYGEITTYSLAINRPLRVIKSKSKFGYPRLTFLVIDPAQLTPFGVSRVRLATPSANYANIYLQSTAKMQLLNADPPILQKGQFTTPVRLRRGETWRGVDADADVKLMELSNSTLNQFTSVLKFIDEQIYSIMGVTPGSIGKQDTGSTYKNTVASNMEKNASDLSSNQITNILENHLRQYALTALDLFISEQVGKTPLIVDDQCKNAINNIAQQKFQEAVPTDPMTGMPTQPFVPPIGDDNTVMMDWEKFYDNIQTWTVSIDLSMSKNTLDEKNRADLQDMLTVMSQTANPNDPNAQARIRNVEDLLLQKTVPEVSKTAVGGGAPVGAAPAPAQPTPPVA